MVFMNNYYESRKQLHGNCYCCCCSSSTLRFCSLFRSSSLHACLAAATALFCPPLCCLSYLALTGDPVAKPGDYERRFHNYKRKTR